MIKTIKKKRIQKQRNGFLFLISAEIPQALIPSGVKNNIRNTVACQVLVKEKLNKAATIGATINTTKLNNKKGKYFFMRNHPTF